MPANQEPNEEKLPDLTTFSIEQLIDLDVTSVTKTSATAKHVAAAIYVIKRRGNSPLVDGHGRKTRSLRHHAPAYLVV